MSDRKNQRDSGARRRRNRKSGFPQVLRDLDIPMELLRSGDPRVRKLARSHAIKTLTGAFPGQNFDWGSLLDGFLDAGSAFGDLVMPGLGTASRAAKLVYKQVKPKPVAKILKTEEKKIERIAEKEAVRNEGLYTGTRPSVNMVRRARVRPGSRDTVLIDGCDVITNLTSGSAGLQSGQVVSSIRLNPLVAGAMQLRSACARYEQYSVRKLTMHNPGGAGTTVSGTLITLFDYDPDDLELTGVGDENVRVALTHAGAQTHTLWQGFTHHYSRAEMAQTRLYISDNQSERRLTDAGRFYVIAGQPVAANVAIGPLYMEWELELHVRSDDNQGPTGEGFYFSQSGGCSTSSKFGSSSTAVVTSMGLTPISIDYTAGTIVLPAGNYLMVDCLSSATGLTAIGSSLIDAQSPAVTDPTKNFTAKEGSDIWISASWISSTSQFTTNFNRVSAGFWSYRIYVVAVGKSPYGVTLRDLRRVLSLASNASSDAKLVEQIQADNQRDPEGDPDDSKEAKISSQSSSALATPVARATSSRRL